MWGIAWGIKIKNSEFEAEEPLLSIDIIEYINGSGERIRTSDLRVMRTKVELSSYFLLVPHCCS